MKDILDQYLLIGLSRAEDHFRMLQGCARSILPDAMHDSLPKTLEEIEGLFSASTTAISLPVFPDTDGYATMNAEFEFGDFGAGYIHWKLVRYTYTLPGSLFHKPREYSASCLEDALVISRRIATYREKFTAESGVKIMESTSDTVLQ